MTRQDAISTAIVDQFRQEAINALVELDVAKWGEGEREAARQIYCRLSLGLARNALANRADIAGDPRAAELRKQADAALTAADWAALRHGG
jgi:hypothetical protein